MKRLRRYSLFALVLLSTVTAGCKSRKYTWSTEEEYFRLPLWQKRVDSFKKITMKPNTALLFIGDSMTEGYRLDQHFPGKPTVNMGVSGDFTSGVLMRLETATRLEPKKIFVMIGINDILKKVPFDRTIYNYSELLRNMRMQCPGAQIYVQSNLPTTGMGGSAEINASVVRQVRSLNDFLREQSKALGIAFVDMYKAFEVNGGELNPAYTYDGLHLNDEGYKVWSQYISTFIETP